MAEDKQAIEVWELWYPGAAAHGLSFARGRLDATDVLLVHSLPETIDIDVRDDEGALIARSTGLASTGEHPMARLTRRGDTIEREDCWPTPEDIGRPVILPGGEVGILKSWWNAEDEKSWRWQVEFFNEL